MVRQNLSDHWLPETFTGKEKIITTLVFPLQNISRENIKITNIRVIQHGSINNACCDINGKAKK
jgi:hypothetical protein